MNLECTKVFHTWSLRGTREPTFISMLASVHLPVATDIPDHGWDSQRRWDLAAVGHNADHHRAIWWRSSFEMAKEYAGDPFMEGPSQADDLGLLVAAIKETRPKTIAEIGFYRGDGTRALLSAADPTSKVFSFDVHPLYPTQLKAAISKAKRNGIGVASWQLTTKNATELVSSDVEHRAVDFVFFDGPHRLEINKAIFRRLLPLLSPFAIIAVHDTGYWSPDWLKKTMDGRKALATWCDCPRCACQRMPGTATGRQMLLHQNTVHERKFIEWVLKNGSGRTFNSVSFHSFDYLRNGVTLLQRKHRNDNDWRRQRR